MANLNDNPANSNELILEFENEIQIEKHNVFEFVSILNENV